MNQKNQKIRIAFFGTPDRAVAVLEALKHADLAPSLIITQPDRFQGRKKIETSPPVKIWAQKHGVPVLQPENLKDHKFMEILKNGRFDLFVVVAYGEILKPDVLSIPKHGCLNLHPSLLPLLRGSSPVETAILEDEKNTGVTIMLMDDLVDHGPIVRQKKVVPPSWPLPAEALSDLLMSETAKLLVEVIPLWILGKIKVVKQDHSKATFTKKIEKSDGQINLNDDPYKNYLKFMAYGKWPRTYFFAEKDGIRSRVIISGASFDDGSFVIKKVIPEGKKEMSFSDFRRNYKISI